MTACVEHQLAVVLIVALNRRPSAAGEDAARAAIGGKSRGVV